MELNKRQKAIIALLTEVGEPMRLEEISEALGSYYEELLYVGGKTPFCNTRARRILTDDIKVINEFAKNTLIATDNNSGVFIVDETNYKVYLEREKSKIMRMLTRYYKKAKKMAKAEEYAALSEAEKKMYDLLGDK